MVGNMIFNRIINILEEIDESEGFNLDKLLEDLKKVLGHKFGEVNVKPSGGKYGFVSVVPRGFRFDTEFTELCLNIAYPKFVLGGKPLWDKEGGNIKEDNITLKAKDWVNVLSKISDEDLYEEDGGFDGSVSDLGELPTLPLGVVGSNTGGYLLLGAGKVKNKPKKKKKKKSK